MTDNTKSLEKRLLELELRVWALENAGSHVLFKFESNEVVEEVIKLCWQDPEYLGIDYEFSKDPNCLRIPLSSVILSNNLLADAGYKFEILDDK